MGKTAVFYDWGKATKAKHLRVVNHLFAETMNLIMTRDELDEQIKRTYIGLGLGYSEKMSKTYCERMRMASVFSGPEHPTIDLNGDNLYYWIKDGSAPAGFLRLILTSSKGCCRLAFDYFVLMAKHYSLEEVVIEVGPENAMWCLLQAEYYARVARADDYTVTELEFYLEQIAKFKAELQGKITRSQRDGFNTLASGLLLSAPKKAA